MSIKITTDVLCDDCGTTAPGVEGGRPDRRGARRLVRAERGWTFKKWGGARPVDLCEDCTDNRRGKRRLPLEGIR